MCGSEMRFSPKRPAHRAFVPSSYFAAMFDSGRSNFMSRPGTSCNVLYREVLAIAMMALPPAQLPKTACRNERNPQEQASVRRNTGGLMQRSACRPIIRNHSLLCLRPFHFQRCRRLIPLISTWPIDADIEGFPCTQMTPKSFRASTSPGALGHGLLPQDVRLIDYQ